MDSPCFCYVSRNQLGDWSDTVGAIHGTFRSRKFLGAGFEDDEDGSVVHTEVFRHGRGFDGFHPCALGEIPRRNLALPESDVPVRFPFARVVVDEQMGIVPSPIGLAQPDSSAQDRHPLDSIRGSEKAIGNRDAVCRLARFTGAQIVAADPSGQFLSVNDGVALPPSLLNIYKEIHDETGTPIPASGNLERWARQGVLLLNATLTVRAHQANSHAQIGWQTFTDAVIQQVSQHTQHTVFMLWGGFARTKARLIDADKHLILQAVHPSPLSANRGGWFGNGHFNACNSYLQQHGRQPVTW